MKTLYFIAGLPRSGTSVIANILKQNPEVHAEVNSSLSNLFHTLYLNWDYIKAGSSKKARVLKSLIDGFYFDAEKSFIFDNSSNWISIIPIVEAVLQQKIKILVCVRNPAEILSSYEKARKDNPLIMLEADQKLGPSTSVAARAFHYAGPEGPLGSCHRNIQDAITMGYLDRMLFIDYSRFCGNPKSQTKRIYDFFGLPEFTHDYTNIVGDNMGSRNILGKTTINCVEYLGLDLYDQYNREIFWNAWI